VTEEPADLGVVHRAGHAASLPADGRNAVPGRPGQRTHRASGCRRRWHRGGDRATVSALIDTFGFDALDGGSLAESWRIEPEASGYGPRRTEAELRADLAAAVR